MGPSPSSSSFSSFLLLFSLTDSSVPRVGVAPPLTGGSPSSVAWGSRVVASESCAAIPCAVPHTARARGRRSRPAAATAGERGGGSAQSRWGARPAVKQGKSLSLGLHALGRRPRARRWFWVRVCAHRRATTKAWRSRWRHYSPRQSGGGLWVPRRPRAGLGVPLRAYVRCTHRA